MFVCGVENMGGVKHGAVGEERRGSDVGETFSGANYLVPITSNPKWLSGLLSSSKSRETTQSIKCEALKRETLTVEKKVLLHPHKKSVSMSDDVSGDAVREVTMKTVFVLFYCVFIAKEFHTLYQMTACVSRTSQCHV